MRQRPGSKKIAIQLRPKARGGGHVSVPRGPRGGQLTNPRGPTEVIIRLRPEVEGRSFTAWCQTLQEVEGVDGMVYFP